MTSEPASTLRERERVFRRHVIAEALAASRGNRTKAARALGIQRTWLLRLMRELGLQQYARGTGRGGAADGPRSSITEATSRREGAAALG